MKQTQVKLQDVVITEELAHRGSRPADPAIERFALAEIAKATQHGRDAILHALCVAGLRLYPRGTCGINLLEEKADGNVFRWIVVEGALAQSQGGTAPADHSPCGYVCERRSAQLLNNSARYFEWMQGGDIPVWESLIVPLLRTPREAIGTIWIVSHDEQHRFDLEDLRTLTVLSGHASAALDLHETLY